MVAFWDTSALVSLFTREEKTEQMLARYAEQKTILVAHHAVTECTSAFCRLEREHHLTQAQLTLVLDRLMKEAESWHRVDMSSNVERIAIRCLRLHSLRAMDAIHLASALLISDGNPSTVYFTTLDNRLGDAAVREGFSFREII